MRRFIPGVLNAVRVEVDRSIVKHGDWADDTITQMTCRLIDEVQELLLAVNAHDIGGPHGVLVEATQVASCAVKLAAVVAMREIAAPGPPVIIEEAAR